MVQSIHVSVWFTALVNTRVEIKMINEIVLCIYFGYNGTRQEKAFDIVLCSDSGIADIGSSIQVNKTIDIVALRRKRKNRRTRITCRFVG
jgi:hypothetical protein